MQGLSKLNWKQFYQELEESSSPATSYELISSGAQRYFQHTMSAAPELATKFCDDGVEIWSLLTAVDELSANGALESSDDARVAFLHTTGEALFYLVRLGLGNSKLDGEWQHFGVAFCDYLRRLV